MKHLRTGLAIGTALTAMIALSSCATNEPDAPAAGGGASSGATVSGTLNGVGSSAQGSAQDAWRAAFQTANGSGVTVNYDPQGSGAGRTAFLGGGADFAGSDSYLKDEEIEQGSQLCDGDPIDLPVYISPIALVYNLEGVDELNLDAPTIAGIFSGEITKWNDDAIASQNDGVDLPNANITAVHRSDDSGTTNNFTNYLSKAAPDDWNEDPADTFPFNSGEGANGTSGVIETVTNSDNSIGYADLSQAGDLGVANVKVGEDYVTPSADTASAVAADSPQVSGRAENDVATDVNRTPDSSDEYPVTLISNVIACQTYQDPEKGALVKAYLEYLVSEDGQQAAADAAKSAPLSGALAEKVRAAVDAIK